MQLNTENGMNCFNDTLEYLGEYLKVNQYDPREYIRLINKKALSIQRHNRYIIEIAYCVNPAFFL